MLLQRLGGEGGGEWVPHRHWVPTSELAVAQSFVDAKLELKNTVPVISSGM